MAEDMNSSAMSGIRQFFKNIITPIQQAAYSMVNQINPVAAMNMSAAFGKDVPEETQKKLIERTVKTNLINERRRTRFLHSIDDIVTKPNRNPANNIEDIKDVCKKMAKATGDCDIVIKVSQPNFNKDKDGKKIDKKREDQYLRFKAVYNKRGKFKDIEIYAGRFPGNYKQAFNKSLSPKVWNKCDKTKDAAYLLGINEKGKKAKEKVRFELMDKGRRDVVLSTLYDRINKITDPKTKEDKKRVSGNNMLERETNKIRAIKQLIEDYRKEYGIPAKNEVVRIPLQNKIGGQSYELVFLGGRRGKKGQELPGVALICPKGTKDFSEISKFKNFFKLSEKERLDTLKRFGGLGEHYPEEFYKDTLNALKASFSFGNGDVAFKINDVNFLAKEIKRGENKGKYLVERYDGNGHRFALKDVITSSGRKQKQGLQFVLDPRNKDDIGFQKLYDSCKGSSAFSYAVVDKKTIDVNEEFMNMFRQYGHKDKKGNMYVDLATGKGAPVTRFMIGKDGEMKAYQGDKRLSPAMKNYMIGSVVVSRTLPNNIDVKVKKAEKTTVEKSAASVGIKKNLGDITHEIPKNMKKYLKDKALSFLDIDQPTAETTQKEADELKRNLMSGGEKSTEDIRGMIESIMDKLQKDPTNTLEVSLTTKPDGSYEIKMTNYDFAKDSRNNTIITSNEETVAPNGTSTLSETTKADYAQLAENLQKVTEEIQIIPTPQRESQDMDISPKDQKIMNEELGKAEIEISRDGLNEIQRADNDEREAAEREIEKEERDIVRESKQRKRSPKYEMNSDYYSRPAMADAR